MASGDRYFILHLWSDPRKVTGPLAEGQLVQELKSGRVSWSDLAWNTSSDRWLRLWEIADLRPHIPPVPARDVLESYMTSCRNAALKRDTRADESNVLSKEKYHAGNPDLPPIQAPVCLHVRRSEHGPMQLDEFRSIMKKVKFEDQVYIWYLGLRTWVPVQDIPEFSSMTFPRSQMKQIPHESVSAVFANENRRSVRKQIPAMVRQVGAHPKMPCAIVADISESGMQIRLESEFVCKKGDELEVEIQIFSPASIPPIRCLATVVWVRPEQYRIGFTFVRFTREEKERLQEFFTRIEKLPYFSGLGSNEYR